jgi:hypothetical protein
MDIVQNDDQAFINLDTMNIMQNDDRAFIHLDTMNIVQHFRHAFSRERMHQLLGCSMMPKGAFSALEALCVALSAVHFRVIVGAQKQKHPGEPDQTHSSYTPGKAANKQSNDAYQ